MAFADVRNIVILTGAGVSAESGVATFRGPDGLWEGHRVEDVATPEGFRRDRATLSRREMRARLNPHGEVGRERELIDAPVAEDVVVEHVPPIVRVDHPRLERATSYGPARAC